MLGHPGETWSPRSKEDVVLDIDKHGGSYYARQGAETVEIATVHPHKYLRTKPDGRSKNNLSNLPELPEDKNLVGYFKVTSGQIVISDPCWAPNTKENKELGLWRAGAVDAKNGTWRATVEPLPEGRALVAVCEKGEMDGEMEMADFEVGVDAAQVGMFCASAYPSPEKPKPGFHKACRETPRKHVGAAIIRHRGVIVGTDDGSYRAFVGYNKDNVAVALRIEVE